MFNYNHLYYFYVTAKQGGVMNAARALRIAQPSLSAQLKTLEGELDLSLFQKVGRRLVLTPDGERAFGFCRKIFEAAEEFSDYLQHSASSKGQRCRIGVTREIERPFIADILTRIFRKKKMLEQPLLSMSSNEHSTLMESLRSGELDAVVTNHPNYGQDFRTLAELSMPVVAVAAPNCIRFLAGKKPAGIAAIVRESKIGLVLPSEKLKLRIETDLCLQKLKVRNPVVLESDILAVVVRATVEGVGIALLPQPYISRELHHETLKYVGNAAPLWHHSLFLVSRNSKFTNPIVGEVRDHFIGLGGKSPRQ
jgi:LysR family transcriptional activator of nhaA